MEFRILGSLEVLENGQAVELGGAKQRALLAILLLRANEVVSTDRLIDALWDENAPETGRKALQVYVSQLRKAIGSDRLRTKAPGYMLLVDDTELDLHRFERLVEANRHRDALMLWRGPALSEFAYQGFAQSEIARLEEIRIACFEDRIEADLVAGRHGGIVGELEMLVGQNPLRERVRAQLMLALYRSGRQAEALDAFQDLRRALVEELGIDPSRPTRELQQAILQQDPALDLPRDEPSVPALEPAPLPPPPQSAEPVTRESRKSVTAIAIALDASSAQGARLDPEARRRMSSHAFGEIQAAVERHGGSVETLTGDGLTAVFGLPLVHEDDALRAVRAADEIHARVSDLARQLLDEHAARLELRIGVSTGEVVTGDPVGGQPRATGEPFTVSFRLGHIAQAGETLLDEATNRLVRDSVVVEASGVDSEPVIRLVQLIEAPGRRVSRFASPMVGRERERRRLEDAFEQAVSDLSCHLFTILGPAGVGKSRLVREFLGDIGGQVTIARGRCLSYGEGITFWPVLEAVKDLTELDDTESVEQSRRRVAALLGGAEDADVLAQQVTEVIGVAEAAVGVEESFTTIRRFFEALAVRLPLLVVFDDIHWGETTFLDLVEHIVDWTRDAPLLLVCVARPELLDARPGWGGGKPNATSILLEPLSDEQCGRLIENLIGETELADEVATRVTAAAEGNPLFVEEMLSMLIDDGLLAREHGRWVATRNLSDVPVPATIRALLAARLDQLDALERSVIESAAIEGKVFHAGSVADLSGLGPGSAVATTLAALVRKELIRPDRPFFGDEQAFRFRHLLIRDAAYDSITKETRAILHEQHAGWLERKVVDRTAEYDEIIGYHLEQAFHNRAELGPGDEADRALGQRGAERLGAAGRRAFARRDASAGLNLVSRAAALLSPDDPLRVDLVPNIRLTMGMRDLSWADRVLTEAVEAASTSGDRRLAAHALVQRGLLRLFAESQVTPQELVDVSDRAIAVFEELGDELGLARAWRLIGQAHYLGRRARSSVDASERALIHARRAGDRFEEREIVEWLVIALVVGPTTATDALARCRHLLAAAAAAGPPLPEAQILGAMAAFHAMQGRVDEADELMARCRSVMDDAGEWDWMATYPWGLGQLWRGDPVAAEATLRPGYAALKRLGEKTHFSSITEALAGAVALQGRYQEAEQFTRECEEASRANDVHSHIMWRAIRAEVLARQGSLEPAERLGREAVALAEGSDFLLGHANALTHLSAVVALAGRAEEAEQLREEAARIHDRKGNVVAAQKVRAGTGRVRPAADQARDVGSSSGMPAP